MHSAYLVKRDKPGREFRDLVCHSLVDPARLVPLFLRELLQGKANVNPSFFYKPEQALIGKIEA
jgi:hypothetical protein